MIKYVAVSDREAVGKMTLGELAEWASDDLEYRYGEAIRLLMCIYESHAGCAVLPVKLVDDGKIVWIESRESAYKFLRMDGIVWRGATRGYVWGNQSEDEDEGDEGMWYDHA